MENFYKESIQSPEVNSGKLEIPLSVQKNMLEFFMRTSIPRKKANNEKHLLIFSEEETGR